MTALRTASIVTICLLCADVSAQNPELTRQQRDLLHTVVRAVDASASAPESTDVAWQTHVLRASDGSHYVAFSAQPPSMPKGPVLLYVRLDSARSSSSTQNVAARSPIREWLAGERTATAPLARRGIVIGEMPIMGAPSIVREDRQPMSAGTANLAVVDLERRRAQEREAERDRQRRAAIEGRAPIAAEVVAFEDFDVAATSLDSGGRRVIARALTAGPGLYYLYAGWADPSAPTPAASVRVIKKAITLPVAEPNRLSLSSVILADSVRVRSAPYPPLEQAGHPYSIGLTEVTPAPDTTFANNEHLNVFFQVINPRASDNGKPDVEITSRVVRLGERVEPVASLTPLTYSASNLPEQFDLRSGHPVFAALSAPLESLRAGAYRLEIVVNDRLGSRSSTTAVDFNVTATAASLLRDAPPPASPFDRTAVLGRNTLPYLLQSLRPASPSPALQRALDIAAAERFIDLMVEEPVAKGEEGVRAVLTGIAHLAVGDQSAAVQFQRGVLLGAAIAPSRILSGAARAFQGRDPDAITGWLEALKAGAPRSVVAPLLLDAYLRRGDYPRAAALVSESKDLRDNTAWTVGLAALDIAQKNDASALTRLDAHLAAHPDDLAAQWLRLHALYAQVVGGTGAARSRFETEARAYIAAKGPNAAVAEEWLQAIF